MTQIRFAIFRGHYYVPLHFLRADGTQISEPVLAFVDTGASKCSIPKEANNVFKLPVIGHDDNINTASNSVGYDVVSVPVVSLMKLEFSLPSKFQTIDTDLQEQNVQAWLGSRYIVGMNLVSKFDISFKRTGHIVIER